MALNDMWSTVDPGPTYDSSNAEMPTITTPSAGSQWEQMVYGTFRDHKQVIDQALQQIGQQTGLPANFDWKPYLEQAARDHIQTYGKSWDERYSNNAEPVVKVIQFAMQDSPQLRPIYQQIGPGTAYWQQGEAARQSAASSSKASDKQNTMRLLSVLAAPVAAAFLGPATGAAGAGGESTVAGFGEAGYAGGGAAAGSAGAGATAGSGNMLLAQAGGNTMTDVSPGLLGGAESGTAAGGFTAAQAGAMPVSELGMVANPATAATATAGGVPASMVGAGSGGAGALTLGQVAGGATLADQILGPQTNSTQGSGPGEAGPGGPGGATNGAAAAQGAYQIPWADIFKGAVGVYGANQAQSNASGLLDKVINSDQWRTQAPRYYEPIYNAATQGLGNTAYGNSITDATMRKASSLGYNISGNMLQDLNKGLNSASMDYVKALTPLATGRGETAGANNAITSGILNSGVQGTNAMGGILEAIYRGQQPTGAQQAQGASTNQNLYESLS